MIAVQLFCKTKDLSWYSFMSKWKRLFCFGMGLSMLVRYCWLHISRYVFNCDYLSSGWSIICKLVLSQLLYINNFIDNQLCNFTLNKSYRLMEYFFATRTITVFFIWSTHGQNGLYKMWSNTMSANLNLTLHVRIM